MSEERVDLIVRFRPPDGLPKQLKQRPASLADVVAWLTEQGVGEVSRSVGVTFEDMPDGCDGLILAVASRGWRGPARYLLVPIGEAITKEDEK